jgi:hypothetical protein
MSAGPFVLLDRETQAAIREMIANGDSAFTGDPAQASAGQVADLITELLEMMDGERDPRPGPPHV